MILKRAAELAETSAAESRSMSLSEVEQVATEAGIDSALVRRAAHEIARPPVVASQHNAFLGGPVSLLFETVLDGEIDTAVYEDLVQVMREQTGDVGEVSILGRSLAWSSRVHHPQKGGAPRALQLSASVRGGQTSVRLEEGLGNLAGGLFGGVVGGVGGGAITLPIFAGIALSGLVGIPAGLLSPVLGVAWVGGVYALVRRGYGSLARKKESQLKEAFDRIVAIGESALVPLALSPAEGA